MSAQHLSHATVYSTRKNRRTFQLGGFPRSAVAAATARGTHAPSKAFASVASGFRAIGATGIPTAAMTTTNPSGAQTPSQRPRPSVVRTRRIIHGTTPHRRGTSTNASFVVRFRLSYDAPFSPKLTVRGKLCSHRNKSTASLLRGGMGRERDHVTKYRCTIDQLRGTCRAHVRGLEGLWRLSITLVTETLALASRQKLRRKK